MKLFLKILFFIVTMLIATVGEVKSSTVVNLLLQETAYSFFQESQFTIDDFENSCSNKENTVTCSDQDINVKASAAKTGANVLSKSELLRIENAATRINKPIHVVGSRASGKAGAYSDWDYIIEGGLKNSREWSTIKNSLPGARSVLDNTPRMIDIHPGPIWPGYPYITIYPR